MVLSTCCWACCARARAWPPACSRIWTPTRPRSGRRHVFFLIWRGPGCPQRWHGARALRTDVLRVVTDVQWPCAPTGGAHGGGEPGGSWRWSRCRGGRRAGGQQDADAGGVWNGSHETGRGGQAGPRHRPRQGGRARDAGPTKSSFTTFTRWLCGNTREIRPRPLQLPRWLRSRFPQILGRRTKNNPCLVGEPGVGKSAIAEGLAQKIAGGDVPETLEGKRMITLDMGLLACCHAPAQCLGRCLNLWPLCRWPAQSTAASSRSG